MLLPLMQMIMSSANIFINQPFAANQKYTWWIIENQRNKDRPLCDTRWYIHKRWQFSITKRNLLTLMQYDSNHSNSTFLLPYSDSFFNNRSRSMVSKYLLCPTYKYLFFYSHSLFQASCFLLYVVGDLFPAGPIPGIFVLYASTSCYGDFSSEIDFWYRFWIPPQIVWWIHVHKIENCDVVTTTGSEMTITMLTNG